ncbi:MAG: MazG nucleotide pyrophosphohydrolase domain-containing protein [Candidatus Woesearchaeota archaeon]|jgi:NTP pyrophosphatase (non-canonical NTP hydrolase)
MDIKQFQDEVIESFSIMDKLPNRKPHTKQTATTHLMEEVGEVARQVTSEYHRPEKFNKDNLGEELADTMMFIVLLAKLYDVDIASEMKKSVEKTKKRAEEFSKKK